jgi:hypothetical protein
VDSPDPFSSWLAAKRSVAVSQEFSSDVMRQIALCEENRRTAYSGREMLQRWLDWVSLRPVLKAALLCGALLAGAARIYATLQIIFSS